jgi:4'-phosphopantetheinyl transferase
METLTDEELERMDALRFAADRRRYAAAHAALRHLLAAYTGVDPADLIIKRTLLGKPFIAVPSTGREVQFNMSHSGEWCLIAVSRREPLGIDLERVRAFQDMDGIVDRFFPANERCEYFKLAQSERTSAFFAVWTRMEACLKAAGTGLAGLDRIDVGFLDSRRTLVLNTAVETAGTWSLHHLEPVPGYMGALAVRRPGKIRCQTWIWSWKSV